MIFYLFLYDKGDWKKVAFFKHFWILESFFNPFLQNLIMFYNRKKVLLLCECSL